MTHTQARIIHTQKRAKQNHNFTLTRKGYGDLVAQIQTGKAKAIAFLGGNRSLHIPKHKDIPLPAIYDNERAEIATTPKWGHFWKLARG